MQSKKKVHATQEVPLQEEGGCHNERGRDPCFWFQEVNDFSTTFFTAFFAATSFNGNNCREHTLSSKSTKETTRGSRKKKREQQKADNDVDAAITKIQNEQDKNALDNHPDLIFQRHVR